MTCNELPNTLGYTVIQTGKLLLKTINGSFVKLTSEITFEQMGVLYYISRNKEKEMIQQDLAQLMEKTKSAVLRTIDILEQKGFVKRVAIAADKRKNVIELTTNGKKIIKKMHTTFLKQDAILEKGIPAKDLEICIAVLLKIQEKCK